ncbi:MAG: hypothetical protein JSW12_18565 [Deltaproteobacteria bacterium]|nr:MAG: hypothetical protein JSW12_18565 [Deltaproteobacteria bacterium]
MKYRIDASSFTVTVTFDKTKTTVKKIIEGLSGAGYPVSGEPRWVN